MNRLLTKEVLTLAETAKFLRVSPAKVRKLAETGKLPAQRIDDEWRFLKSALEEWLRGKPDPTQALLQQAGLFKHSKLLPEILKEIYKARGRPDDGEMAS